MKHNKIIILTIIFFFILTQVLGIIVLEKAKTQNNTQNNFYDFKDIQTSFDWNIIIAIILGLTIGFLMMKIIIKTKQKNLWIILYYYITYTLLYTTLSVFINKTSSIIITLTLLLIKNFKKTPQIIKNFIEILFYPAFALLFSPILTPILGIIVLILISFYDMYMVWKSKEMIKLAEFQLNTKFTGILIEYEDKEKQKEKEEKTTRIKENKITKIERKNTKEQKNKETTKTKEKIEKTNLQKDKQNFNVRKAILGGGDLAFTTMFTGTIYLNLGIKLAILTIIFSTVGLTYLFLKSEKGKMYPAMPYITFFTIIPTITYYIIQTI